MGEEGVPAPVSLGSGEGETLQNPLGGPITFKVRRAETGGTMFAFESTAAPGEGPPLHIHRAQDFAGLDEGADWSEAFKRLGADAGMDVVGPPLAVSDPI